MVRCLNGDGFARAAHARVNHRHVNGAPGKEPAGRRQRKRSAANVPRRNFVRDVHHRGAGLEAENDAFHRAHEPVAGAEVSGQCNDAHGPERSPNRRRGTSMLQLNAENAEAAEERRESRHLCVSLRYGLCVSASREMVGQVGASCPTAPYRRPARSLRRAKSSRNWARSPLR